MCTCFRLAMNGSYVVIFVFHITSKNCICLHFFKPESRIPHSSDADRAIKCRNVFANGSHVVILLFPVAFKYSIAMQCFNPLSFIPQSSIALNLHKDFANGSHVVIFLL